MPEDEITLVLEDISQLICCKAELPKKGRDLEELNIKTDVSLFISGDKIVDIGSTNRDVTENCVFIDCQGKTVLPGFVDCHTHLVFGGARYHEYRYKIQGQDYSKLHETGGILYTVKQTRLADKETLYRKAIYDLRKMLKLGTTTVEIKSGYGLERNTELKLLAIIKQLQDNSVQDIVSTFLGAHTIPEEYRGKREKYVQMLKKLILDISGTGITEFCDVFCDKLGFSIEETDDILSTASLHGFKLKLHACQTSHIDIIPLLRKYKIVSVDHLDYLGIKGDTALNNKMLNNFDIDEIRAFNKSGTIAVLLPAVTYHLMELTPGGLTYKQHLPYLIHEFLESEMPVALATDYNPGSANTFSMKTVCETAARLYRMTPEQIINAATINSAFAIDRHKILGSIEEGKQADIIISNCESYEQIIERFGDNPFEKIIKKGEIVAVN